MANDTDAHVSPMGRINAVLAALRTALLLGQLTLLCGCAQSPWRSGPHLRPFVFGTDTFAYPNELEWVYGFDTAGKWRGEQRKPAPDYTLHCFVVVRDARQFFYHARFDPRLPRVNTQTYIASVNQVLQRDRFTPSPEAARVVIPGYANLHEFSRYWEALLKFAGGGAWQSFLQRGNWRMVFPFTRMHQEHTARELLAAVVANRLPIVHAVTFPERTLDHAVLIYAGRSTSTGIDFDVYDPNDARQSITLRFDAATRTFQFPRTRYFYGGAVDVYEVYKNLVY